VQFESPSYIKANKGILKGTLEGFLISSNEATMQAFNLQREC
jgi:hypothetical protein